jgi:hypothetical protein
VLVSLIRVGLDETVVTVEHAGRPVTLARLGGIVPVTTLLVEVDANATFARPALARAGHDHRCVVGVDHR